MGLFGRRQPPSHERTAADRERARYEREARRARREGRPAPPMPASLAEADWAEDVAEHPPYEERTAPPAGEPSPVADAALPPSFAAAPADEQPPPHGDAAPPPSFAAAPADEQPPPHGLAAPPVEEPPPPVEEPPPHVEEPPPHVEEPPPHVEEPPPHGDAAPPVEEPPLEPAPLAQDEPPSSGARAAAAGAQDPAPQAPNDASMPRDLPSATDGARAASHDASADAAWDAQAEPAADPWFEDDAAAEHVIEPVPDAGQATVEWDVLSNRPKHAPPPPSGPAGIDAPTAEWDPLKHDATPRVTRASAPPARPAEPTADAEPDDRAQPVTGAAGGSRFDDEEERPVPVRRVPRSARTLPAAPRLPSERGRLLGVRRSQASSPGADGREPRSTGKGGFRLPSRPAKPGKGGAPAGPPRRRGLRRLAILVAALVVVLVAAWFALGTFQPLAGGAGGPVKVSVPEQATVSDVGELLEREGVVDSAFFFRLRARLESVDVQAGTYTLREGMTNGAALEALAEGAEAPPTVGVTIPEGRARRETAPLVEQAGLSGSYLAASERARGFNPRRYGMPSSARSLEGFLFPATYELPPGSTAKALVAQQLDAFEKNIATVDMSRARRANLTVYDVLIIASMIEREATLAKERPLVSAVIYNRLKAGMPLGIDATIRFATRNWTRPLRQSELAIDSPYNTRTTTGLPPGPIGSPGLESIKAAANPAKVDYLYYVVKPGGDGAHNFSSTGEQFNRDVAEYNRAREANGGRSPAGSGG